MDFLSGGTVFPCNPLCFSQEVALMGFKQFGGALDPHWFTSPQVYGV